MSTKYNPSIVRDNLILYVDAGNSKSYPGSGTTWKDLSGRGHHMTLNNGPTFNSNFGGYLDFDGTNDSATVEIGNLAGTTKDATISIWMDGDYNNSTHKGLIGFRQSGDNNGFFILRLVTSGRLEMRVANSGGQFDVKDATTFTPLVNTNVWCNLCLTYSNSNTLITGYYNGKKLGSTTTNATAFQSNMKSFAIARSPHSLGHMSDMKASSAMVYEKCLSSSEVQQNFNALKGRFGF